MQPKAKETEKKVKTPSNEPAIEKLRKILDQNKIDAVGFIAEVEKMSGTKIYNMSPDEIEAIIKENF